MQSHVQFHMPMAIGQKMAQPWAIVMYARITCNIIIYVSNAICYGALRLAFACQPGNWRASRLYDELPVYPSTQGHLTITFRLYIVTT
jgi:hypothetical protein